jgi:flagellar motility protein MotE (MotC chaperone)
LAFKFTKGGFTNPLEANSQTNAASSPEARASLSALNPAQAGGSITGDMPTESNADTSGKSGGSSWIKGFSFSSNAEKNMLLQLDQRRVELEQRKQILDDKERELQAQAQLVAEKVTELKALIAKLSTLRKDKDHKYEARMEQLASVYSAMAPNEAGSLISKLDDEVGLGLLERMPGKRMAQILGVMDQNRALELTKSLTSRKKL